MKTIIINIETSKLRQHPYHQEVYESRPTDTLEVSFKRTGDKPVYPIVVVPHSESDLYWVISGMTRLDTLIQMGKTEAEVILYEITDESEIKNLIIDLNKQRGKTGRELLHEFRHFLEMYPEKRGVPGNRYSKIGKEIGRSKDRVKNYVMLNNFFEGEGDIILEHIFSGDISVAAGKDIKNVVEKYPEKFDSENSFTKICDPKFDYKRLDYGISSLSLEDDHELQLLQEYLQKDSSTQEFHKSLEQMGKVEKRVDSHDKSKVFVPIVDEVYTTDNTRIIRGNNREVEFDHPFEKKIRCLIGSPPYGNRRLNGDDPNTDTGHNMTGQEYGQYLSETYERYKPHLAEDGSVYVIVDDYRLSNGAHACSLEHFVVEMEKKGFYLVGRYTWVKDNPMPRSHADKDMVNGFEMVYRFSLDPKDYYCSTDLFIELEKGTSEGFKEGCTNSDGKGNTTRGTSYYQSHLKKVRNTLDKSSCSDVIKGNVANPDDFFRQADEKKHTSTYPMYLSSTLILESTQPDDLVVDIWNDVGNTMDSALLLGRKYVGVELENDYFQQTCRRADYTEEILKLNSNDDLKQAA
jgi:DNA modification methylase